MERSRTNSQRSINYQRNATTLEVNRADSYASSAHEIMFTEAVESQREKKSVYQYKVIVVGDFIFSAILWLLIMVTHGDDLLEDFVDEINLLDPKFFSKSMFDVLICAFIRCSVLFFLYGFYHIKNMYPVSITSLITAILVGVKVIYYFRGQSTTPIPPIILIIGTIFIIGVELSRIPSDRATTRHDDDEQLIPSNSESQAYRNARIEAIQAGITDGEYRTAMELSDSSDDDDSKMSGVPLNRYQRKVRKLLHEKALQKTIAYRTYSNAEFHETICGAKLTADRWLNEINKWSRANNIPLVKWTDDKEYGRVYYMQTEIAVPPETVFNVLYTNFKTLPKWNKNVLVNKIICQIDATTDVIHSLTSSQMGGAISSRDFLDVRQFEYNFEKKIYIIVLQSVYADLLPPSTDKKIVRGLNGPNYWRIRPVQDDCHTIVEWFNNTNLRVSLPRRLMHTGMVNFLIDYSKLLNEQCLKFWNPNL